VDGTILQARVYSGYAKAAARVGLPYDQYRAATPFDPLAADNKIATLDAAFTIHSADNFEFKKPGDGAKVEYHALTTGGWGQLHESDYLVGAMGTFFVSSVTPAMPPVAILCNRVCSIWTPGPQTTDIGVLGYGGTVAATDAQVAADEANETAIGTIVPASVILKGGVVRDTYLPTDAGHGAWRIQIPHFAGLVIRQGTIFTDDKLNRFVTIAGELQGNTWRVDVDQRVV